MILTKDNNNVNKSVLLAVCHLVCHLLNWIYIYIGFNSNQNKETPISSLIMYSKKTYRSTLFSIEAITKFCGTLF
jgi:hypothetical protein